MHETNRAHAKLAERVTGLPQTDIRTMTQLAVEQDGDIVDLGLGEPDFDTPAHIVDAAHEAAAAGATHYTSNVGIDELKSAIASTMREKFGAVHDPDSEIVVTAGGIQAAYFAMLATVNAGEEIIVPTPAWPSYHTQAALLDIDLVEVPLSAASGFDLNPDAIADAMSDRTAAIVLNTPSNPTGRMYSPETVKAVLDLAADHDVYVIADEVYEQITYDDDHRSIPAMAEDPNRVLSVHSFSKAYAMTGWRVGWLTGPEDVLATAPQLHQAMTTCASSVSQYAALAALTGPQEPVEEMLDAFAQRQAFIVERFESMPHVSCPTPQGGFYAFPDVSALPGSSLEIAKRLLVEYGVVTVPGTGFGAAGAGHLRLSFANSIDRLELALDRFEQMVQDELNG